VAYDEELAKKIADVLAEQGDFDERKMFGGIAFMVKGHMCCGVINEDLMLRLGPEGAAKALDDAHVRPMDFTGRPMKGYVYIAKDGLRSEAKLRKRIQAALDFVATLPAK
jgi:TfoX/Sxy family transcriptional regulator of competence genes